MCLWDESEGERNWKGSQEYQKEDSHRGTEIAEREPLGVRRWKADQAVSNCLQFRWLHRARHDGRQRFQDQLACPSGIWGAPDAARIMWGSVGAGAVSLAVIISSIGALNGWTLLMGQVPMAAARDGLFPPVFGRLSGRGVPAVSIVISAGLATALVLVQAAGTPGFSAFYNLVVSLSTMAAVIPYAFCALAGGFVAARVAGGGPVPRVTPVEVIAFLFSIFTVYGCGPEPVLYGLMLLLLGIPVYTWQRRRM